MQDRRKSPRIHFKRNRPDFFVKLIVKRFFFRDHEIICSLRNISEGGASLLLKDEDRKLVTQKSVGTRVRLLSENPDLSFRLERRGKILRIIDMNGQITVVVEFARRAP